VIRCFYGKDQNYVDVTEQVLRTCSDGDRIYIPANDTLRGSLFPDPLFGVVKNIVVIQENQLRSSEFDAAGNHLTGVGSPSCSVYAAHTAVTVYLNQQERQELYPDTNSDDQSTSGLGPPPSHLTTAEDQIAWIHAGLTFAGGSLTDELPEQTMVVRFLDPAAKVLELGANIGRNTLMIAAVLADQHNLVSLECDPVSVEMLRNNRFANRFTFHIEPSALSYRKLIQKGWQTVPSEAVPPGYVRVQTITFEELQSKYGIEFDTLVADCEGALYWILRDNEALLKNIHTVIVEADYASVEHKMAVEAIFHVHGLERIYSEPLAVDWDHPFPAECAESFFEVWKKKQFVGSADSNE
jgi:FkbM family methyltransferase